MTGNIVQIVIELLDMILYIISTNQLDELYILMS